MILLCCQILNTDGSTRWAMKNFTDWYQDYNARNLEEPCLKEVISPVQCRAVEHVAVCFYFRRNQNGEQYPPRSLYSELWQHFTVIALLKALKCGFIVTYIYIYIYIYITNVFILATISMFMVYMDTWIHSIHTAHHDKVSYWNYT